MARSYNKPPIIEVTCEFRFVSPQPWDLTIPGLIYEQVKEDFPQRRQTGVFELRAEPGGNALQQQVGTRVQFVREDQTALLQLGPSVFSVHHLRPYPKWGPYKEVVLKHLDIYIKAAQENQLARVGLRYVNRIEIPGETIELEKYFCILPKVPEPIPQVFPAFLFHVEIPYETSRMTLNINSGTLVPEKEGHIAFLLDLDMFTVGDNVPDIDQIRDWLEAAHNQVEEAFYASFTEKTHKEIFEEVNT